MPKLLFFTLLALALSPVSAALAAAIQGKDVVSGKTLEVQPGKLGQVVVFLSAECPCSNSHIGLLKKLAKDFPDFSFVGVHSNLSEGPQLTKEYFQTAGLGFPVIQDENTKIADEFKALKTPHAFLLGTEGKILYRGGVTNSSNGESASIHFLRAALESQAKGSEIEVKEGRTLGCVISRKP